ncbi:MerR family DNA-binding transcriptional regulator [Streptomyces sp. NPDC001732]
MPGPRPGTGRMKSRGLLRAGSGVPIACEGIFCPIPWLENVPAPAAEGEDMQIGELARLTGASRRSIRHYAQQGLLEAQRAGRRRWRRRLHGWTGLRRGERGRPRGAPLLVADGGQGRNGSKARGRERQTARFSR